jgi:hypothetical protein
MALTVEDGSVVSGADSYISLSDADTYHEDRDNSTWAALTDDAKEAGLRRATQYIDSHYRMRFKGTKATSGQPLAWPRSNVDDEDGNIISSDSIPAALPTATAEVAVVIPETQEITQAKSLKRVKAGSVEVEYATEAPQREILDLVDELVRPFVNAAGRIVRA